MNGSFQSGCWEDKCKEHFAGEKTCSSPQQLSMIGSMVRL